MLPLTLALLSAAPSVALPGLDAVNVPAAEAQLHSEVLASYLSQRGLKVLTSRDIASVLGLERQKQLLGCSDDSTSCAAELAGALGVDALVTGTIGRLDDEYVLNVKVLSAKDASTLATYTGRAASAKAITARLEEAAAALAAQLEAPLKLDASGPGPSKKWWAVAPAVVGVSALGAGIALQLQARSTYQALLVSATPSDAQTLRDSGKSQEAASVALLTVGAAGLVAAALVVALVPGDVQPTVALAPDGASFGLAGRFP